MAEIRPLEHGDVPRVVELLRTHMDGWDLDERALVGLMLEHPWADEELRSLVAVEADAIVGFTGVQARRLRFEGRSIRGICCTHAIVDPTYRRGAIGALLLTRILQGPQDLTWSDSATEAVERVYRILGGHLDHARACDWLVVFKPVRWVGGIAKATVRRGRISRRTFMPVGGIPAQALGPRLVKRAFPDLAPQVRGEDASAAEIAANVPRLNAALTVWVDHDEEHLTHLFRLVAPFRGPVTRRLVHRADRPVGWYAYLPKPGGVSRVLHLAAEERFADDVVGELVSHAVERGSAALTGRAEPHLQHALARRFAVLGYARAPVLRAKDPALAAALATGSSLLTRLEGEVFGI